MAENIIEQMQNKLAGMTKAQKKVADLIMTDPMEASYSTIDKIAHSADVSTASVIRLANVLGYSTFSEFQNVLKEYMRSGSAPIHRLTLNVRNMEDGVEEDVVTAVYQQGMENLANAVQTLRTETLYEIAEKIGNASCIYITGARTSESTARYLTFNLNRMFLNAVYVGDSMSNQIDLIKKIKPEDVLIVITISRYNKLLCRTAQRCQEKGACVIGITDSYDSPLADCTQVQLVGKCWSTDFHNSILSQIFLADALIKVCSQVNADRVQKNLEYDEQNFSEIQYFVR